MADKQQVSILEQGAKTWNKWRVEHPDIRIDLRGADLREANLSKVNLSMVDLGSAKLEEANFEKANLYRAGFVGASFYFTIFRGANLSEANLHHTDLSTVDLRDADLRQADLSGIHIHEVGELDGADLQDADLSGAVLYQASLRRASLNRANLKVTYFNRVILDNADFSAATLADTLFGHVSLQYVKGLESVIHEGPSTIGVDTLELSEGKIPEVFLRNAGMSEVFLVHARSFRDALSSAENILSLEDFKNSREI